MNLHFSHQLEPSGSELFFSTCYVGHVYEAVDLNRRFRLGILVRAIFHQASRILKWLQHFFELVRFVIDSP